MQKSPDTVTLLASAKVNFTLDVLSRRPDGYHSIATVMQTVSLADTVTVAILEGSGIALECSDPALPNGPHNLAYRAAESILREAHSPKGLRVNIDKRIPAEAGLGGGSSDAAAVLRGASELLGTRVSRTRFTELAASIGSDVPFFLTGGTASCRGRGDIVTPLPDAPPLWFVIVKPEHGVSTASAYGLLDEIPDRISSRSTRAMEEILARGELDRITARMTNDFEAALLPQRIDLAALHDDLLMARARAVRLCGSGSAAFGVAWSRPEAEEIARLMRLKYGLVFVCRSVTRDESLALGYAS